MTTQPLQEPDYTYWSRLARWNYKDAALLLNGIDPFLYLKTKFSPKEMPSEPELAKVILDLQIFKFIN
jgi:hypothetical protein